MCVGRCFTNQKQPRRLTAIAVVNDFYRKWIALYNTSLLLSGSLWNLFSPTQQVFILKPFPHFAILKLLIPFGSYTEFPIGWFIRCGVF